MAQISTVSSTEVFASLVDRVTFHNSDNGFCVLRVKLRGQRDLITLEGIEKYLGSGMIRGIGPVYAKNEHHSTSTCLTISVPMALAIIARETKRSRLLSLGTPIANRPDPVRVAEEMAWLDVLSGGRL
jgi:hypothetical protein